MVRSTAQDVAPAPSVEAGQEGVEPQLQGAVHEAFANPTDHDPTPGPIVKRQPPQDVKEDPPEFMPEGAIWIAGYWIWDDERNDFVWVTGVARKAPPGMRFVPGYWAEAEGGWQRVAGFWVSANAGELEYREAPPQSLENGPSSPAPADNYFWVPGSWNYYDTGYRWRSGYWSPYQPDWIWCPARWVWTPAGFVYCPGFWDYEVSLRGQLFAPVYFRTAFYTHPGWSYRPWCVIPTKNLFIHLWIRPRYCHYYFGNFYGPQYANWGLRSWCHVPTQRYYYDPFFTYCRVHYKRQGIDYIGRCQSWHDYYVRHSDHRPPRTWHEQQHRHHDHDHDRVAVETQLVARNLAEVARRDDAPVRLTRLDDASRRSLVERTEKLRELHSTRKKVERDATQVAVRIPQADDAAKDARDALRESARDLANGKDDRRDVTKGKDDTKGTAENLSKRGSLTERVEDLAKSGRGTELRSKAGTTARLALPKASEATAGGPVVRTGPGNTEQTKVGRRDRIPPPLSVTDGAAPTPGGENAATARNAGQPDTMRRFGRADLYKADRPAGERMGIELPKVNAPRTNATIDVQKGETVKGNSLPSIVRPIETPPVNSSKAEIRRIETPKVEARQVEAPKSFPPRVEFGRKFSGANGDSPRLTPSNESPAPMPRVIPRSESRPMPRLETTREERSKPRVEIPREIRSAPRIDTPSAAPRVTPSVERPSASPRISVPSDSGSRSPPPGRGDRYRQNDN